MFALVGRGIVGEIFANGSVCGGGHALGWPTYISQVRGHTCAPRLSHKDDEGGASLGIRVNSEVKNGFYNQVMIVFIMCLLSICVDILNQ